VLQYVRPFLFSSLRSGTDPFSFLRAELFTHYTEETVMANHPTPEIMRIPLESLCLQIKAMRSDEDVKIFLGKALDPPDVRAIDSAWATLRLLGAIEEMGGTAAKLTPLGMHLAMIPVDLRLGKVSWLVDSVSCGACFDPRSSTDVGPRGHFPLS
jgi:ATP-dependent RNA helicase DHX57